MHIDWGTLAAIAATAAATAVVVVLLVSFAVLGLSAPSGRRVGEPGEGGAAAQPAAAGVALAVVCLLAVGLIVGYGLYLIIA
jgi:hypothetical protein